MSEGEDRTSCPRCGFAEPGPVECPRCGVVFARMNRPPRPAPTVPDEEPVPAPSPGRRFGWLDAVLLGAVVIAGAVIVLRRMEPLAPPHVPTPTRREAPVGERSGPRPPTRRARPAPVPLPTRGTTPEPSGRRADTAPPPTVGGPFPPVRPAADESLGAEDAETFASLSALVAGRQPVDGSHVDLAVELYRRHPDHHDTEQLLKDVLSTAARQAKEQGRAVSARRYLERATDLFPGSSAAWIALLQVHEESGDWREAELVARRGLSALPDDPWITLELARALGRQGRDEEAADGLRRYLARRDDGAIRSELERLERELQSVAGLARRTSAHFAVRFEGEANDALGEGLLRVLEDKYEMLARTLDCEPDRQIPVILLPRETFRSTGTAPNWAGAYYSHSDARIRIGTRDLTPGFVPLDLERTLTHELAHAFIHARTRGAVPDDLNEGLAQYLSGKRLGYRLDPQRAEVRDGRMKVDDFYDSALSFAEFLIDRYRQPTLNDLLRYAGETGNPDQAFRRALHQSYDETRAEWLRSLQ